MKTGRLPLLLGACAPLPILAAVGWAAPVPESVQYSQITVQQTLIVKMPKRPVKQKPIKWKARRGPKCIAMTSIAGAAVVADDAIDLVMRGGQRLRAQFSSRCPALDYYSGFYVLPTEDGQICADRDIIRTRSGGQCEIERFRKLEIDD